MKRLLLFSMAFVLTGCGALAPALPTATAAPTTTPQIVIQTVIVTVIATLPPTQTPTPTLTPIPTFTPQATDLTASPVTTAATGTALTATAGNTTATATLPPDAGGALFTNLTRSSDRFGLNCSSDTITFGVSTTDTNVAEVDLFYRTENQSSSLISGWIDIGKMKSDGSGNFTMDFPASNVAPDLRNPNGWFDYQFVALNRVGQVLGRSGKIVKQITLTPAC